MKPRYIHDCDLCLFLGQYGKYDLYVDSEMGVCPTLILRFSDEPEDYRSGIDFAVIKNADAAYVEALKLALKSVHRKSIIEYLDNVDRYSDRRERFLRYLND